MFTSTRRRFYALNDLSSCSQSRKEPVHEATRMPSLLRIIEKGNHVIQINATVVLGADSHALIAPYLWKPAYFPLKKTNLEPHRRPFRRTARPRNAKPAKYARHGSPALAKRKPEHMMRLCQKSIRSHYRRLFRASSTPLSKKLETAELDEAHVEALRQADHLFQSLLHCAFNADL